MFTGAQEEARWGEEVTRVGTGDEGADDERVRPGVEGYMSVSPSLVYSASWSKLAIDREDEEVDIGSTEPMYRARNFAKPLCDSFQ